MTPQRWKVFDDQSEQLDKFGLLLLGVLVAVVSLSLVDLSPSKGDDVPWGSLIVSAFVVLLFIVAMSATGVAQRWRRTLSLVLMVGYVLTVLVTVTAYDAGTGDQFRPSALWSLLAVLVPVAVVRRVVLPPEVTARPLLRAIAPYLLLAFRFFMVFLSIGAFQDGPFFGRDVGTTEYMYFSLVTITTLGYGDLSPTSNVGQLAAVSEAVIGQVFLVTLVAALVSRFAARPKP